MSEIIEPLMDHAEAERITERIRLTVDTTARNLDKLAKLVAEAFERRADLAMGYGSWAEYSQEEFGEETQTLAPQFRRQLVGMLSAEGMSTRPIASVTGKSIGQTHADIHSGVQFMNTSEVLQHATPASEPEHVRHVAAPDLQKVGVNDFTTTSDVEPETPAVVSPVSAPSAATPEAAPEPTPIRKVTGLDGKQYAATKPQPKERRQNQPALTSQYATAIVELDKAINRIERLNSDERFPRNKENVALSYKSDVQRAIQQLTTIENQLS